MGRTIAISLLALSVTPLVRQVPASFDPVGKWTISTTSDTGTPMTVTIDVSGTPGAYTGQAVTNNNRTLPLHDLATTPTGMIALFDLPQGAIVLKVSRDAAGRFVGAWGEVPQAYPLTAVRQGR